MNKRQATLTARQLYGPTAAAQRVSSNDRNQRFCIVAVEPGGAFGDPQLVVLGYGDSYMSAFDKAEKGERAIGFKNRWAETKKEFEKFKDDPTRYFEEFIDVAKQQYKEAANNGEEGTSQEHEASGVEGGDQDRKEG